MLFGVTPTDWRLYLSMTLLLATVRNPGCGLERTTV
jgi:hypothetical protein